VNPFLSAGAYCLGLAGGDLDQRGGDVGRSPSGTDDAGQERPDDLLAQEEVSTENADVSIAVWTI
jgi:hypothetical protein